MPDGALAVLDELGVARGIELPSIGAVAVTAPRAALETLATVDDRLLAVEPQRRIALDLYASKEQIDAVGMDSPEAYRTSTGSGTRPGVTGDGVTVAVLDSGILEPHPDLTGRVPLGLHFAFSEIQDSGGISYEEWDAYAESTGPIALQDEIGHGTHVASTVGGTGAASADAGGPDLAGVAPGVEFVSMKVADAPFGIVDDIDWEEAALAAFDYIIRHPELGIRIAQNSWGLLPAEPDCLGAGCGEPTDFDGMAAMIGAVEDAGVSVVFSSGNSGPEPDTIGGYHRAGGRVLLLGGEAALSAAIADELAAAGFHVERARGADRFETAVAIANRLAGLVDLTTAIVARGDLFPDALAAGPAATAAGAAILLSEGDQPNAATSAWLEEHEDLEVVAVGGPAAAAHPEARRVAGADRLATAVAVADALLPEARGLALARLDGFADALTGGVHAAIHGMPILLTERDRLSPTAAAWVDRTPSLDRGVVLGGTAAIGDAVVSDLEQRLP